MSKNNNVVDGVVLGNEKQANGGIYRQLKTGEQMIREERQQREHAEKIAERKNRHKWEKEEAKLQNEQSQYPNTIVSEGRQWRETSTIGGILQILLVLLIGAGVFYLLAQL